MEIDELYKKVPVYVVIVNNADEFGGAVGKVFIDVLGEKIQFTLRQCIPSLKPERTTNFFGEKPTIDFLLQTIEAAKTEYPGADYWVSHEIGLMERDDGLWFFGTVLVEHKSGSIGQAFTASYKIPKIIAFHVIRGELLDDAIQKALNDENIVDHGGLVSHLTGGRVTNESLFKQAVAIALTSVPHKIEPSNADEEE